MKIINLMVVTLIVLIVAIGSVCAGTDDGLLSDGDDFDEDNEDDFDLDDVLQISGHSNAKELLRELI